MSGGDEMQAERLRSLAMRCRSLASCVSAEGDRARLQELASTYEAEARAEGDSAAGRPAFSAGPPQDGR